MDDAIFNDLLKSTKDMVKHVRRRQRMDNSSTDEEVEVCVSCGADTQYKKSDHIDYRLGYIEGLGQLCAKCSYTRTFIKGMHS